MRIYNKKVHPYLTLPNGVTITMGGFSDVLNEDFLESPTVKRALENGDIEIDPDPNKPENKRA